MPLLFERNDLIHEGIATMCASASCCIALTAERNDLIHEGIATPVVFSLRRTGAVERNDLIHEGIATSA